MSLPYYAFKNQPSLLMRRHHPHPRFALFQGYHDQDSATMVSVLGFPCSRRFDVFVSAAPTARPIPAWGNAPGMKTQIY
jgi:hypothetical protein